MRAIAEAPYLLFFDEVRLHSAIATQSQKILAVERHDARGKYIQVFIVVRKPPESPLFKAPFFNM